MFLLEQKVGIVAQQKWVTKLLGYDFTIEYKKGREPSGRCPLKEDL